MQQLMLAQHAAPWHAGEGIYHLQQSFILRGHDPSIDAMRMALESLIEEQPVLRTVFLRDSRLGAFAQAVLPSVRPEVVEHNLEGCGTAAQESYFARTLEADRSHGFDWKDACRPMYRFHWLRLEASVCKLLMSIHHAIEDDWGNQHFLGQLFERYRRIKNGERIRTEPKPNVFREFVALEREMALSAQAAAFWKSQDIVPTAPLPQRHREAGEATRYYTRTTHQLLQELRSACRRAGVSLKAAVLVAFAEALRQYVRTDIATVGVVCNGRSERLSDALNVAGLFWNLAPITLRKTAAGELPERDVQRQLSRIEPFAIYPLAEIARLHGAGELFYATLNFTNFHNRFKEDVGDGVYVTAERTHDRFHYPLNCHVGIYARSAVMGMSVEFDTRYFSQGGICRMTALMIEGLQSRVAVLNSRREQAISAGG
jgi:hypothetical protein